MTTICFHRDIVLWDCVFQGRAGYVSQGSNVAQDHAQLPLFSNISESKLRNTTTFSRKRKLNANVPSFTLCLQISCTLHLDNEK